MAPVASSGAAAWLLRYLGRSWGADQREAIIMILGLSIGVFTTIHTIISLAAIAAGVIVLVQMFSDRLSGALTATIWL
jgi:hypothetical protein